VFDITHNAFVGTLSLTQSIIL